MRGCQMEPFPSALLTDLYQLTMIQAYLECAKTETAVFEFFVRKLPAQRSFLMAAGLEQALDLLENLRFSNEELGWLERTGKFNATLIDYLAKFRFSGEVHAIREGSVFFESEPIFAHHRSAPGSTACRDAPHQHSAFSVPDRLQSSAHGAARTRQAARRFRTAPRPWRRRWTGGCPRQLYRRLCRDRDRFGREVVWH